MPEHMRRLITLLVIFQLLVGWASIFHPKSFGVYGHYRAASVEEIAAAESAYINSDSFSAELPERVRDLVHRHTQSREVPNVSLGGGKID